MNPVDAPRRSSLDDGADRLHLLILCVELQLDLLLVTLGSDTDGPVRLPAGTGRPRWDGETLDLTGVDAESTPYGYGRDWSQARLAAIADVLHEMLTKAEIRRHPAVMARLIEARAVCAARLGTAIRPMVTRPVAADPGRTRSAVAGVVPGHFLG